MEKDSASAGAAGDAMTRISVGVGFGSLPHSDAPAVLSVTAMQAIQRGQLGDAWTEVRALRYRRDSIDAGAAVDLPEGSDHPPKKMLVESDKNLMWVAFGATLIGFKVPWEFLWLGKDGRLIDAMQLDLEEATVPRAVRDSAGTLRAFSYEQDSHGTGGAYILWSVVEFPSRAEGFSIPARNTRPALVERGTTEAWMSEPLMKRLCLRQHISPPHLDSGDGTLEYDLRYELLVGESGIRVWRSGAVRCNENGHISRTISITDLLLLDERTGDWRPDF